MISCKSCGSRMLYDIKSAKMKCMHCGTYLPVEETEDYIKSAEEDTFETKIYRCTQCGAELMTQEQSAVSFCSFCGAQSVFEGEFERVKKPEYVIPFAKTKEECKKIYNNRIMRAIYAPSEMKSKTHIDEFRGIYMPYYIYDVEQSGLYSLTGTREYRRGDYIYTDHYMLSGEINGKYHSLSHDASSNFADNVSECIAPYDTSGKRIFLEGYLHGFYADVADVDSDSYRIQMTSQANEYALYNAKRQPEYSGIHIEQSKNTPGLSNRFNTGIREVKSALFPVWFLSTKRAGRMSYATINGQTGRVYADIPIEPWKFIVGTILAAIPLFFMFQRQLVLKPDVLLMMVTFIALITMFLYRNSLKKIIKNISAIQTGDSVSDNKKSSMGSLSSGGEAVITFALVIGVFLFAELRTNFTAIFKGVMIGASVIGIVYSIFGYKLLNEVFEINDQLSYIVIDIAFVVGIAIGIIKPVDDMWYYGAALISIIAVFIMLFQLIRSYNILSSRRPRTFVRKGGDDFGI